MRYQQIKPQLSEEILDEVTMSPSALQKFARSPEAEGMLLGIEFEMGVPGVEGGYDNDPEWEADWSMNERAYDISGIIEFFRSGEFSDLGSRGAELLSSNMFEQFFDWQSEQIREAASDSDQLNEYIRNQIEDNTQASDYEDQAREELGQDASDDVVSDKANELRDDAVDEAMSSREGDLYDSAYDQAIERFEEEMRDDGDFDQEAWLSDIGVNDMEDASSEFGLNWPHMIDANEGGGGMDVDELADEFSKAMGGVKVNTSNNYHGARRDGTSWIIEPDSSIDTDDSDDAGLEFVSPPLPLAQGLETLQQFYAWAKSRGCYTNRSTGLHMNISVPDMTIDKLDYVKLALFLGDEYVLGEFERQYNTYAKSAMKIVREKIEQSPENAAELLAKMKQHLNTAASKLVHTGITSKYTSINTKDNYVEFRGPGGNYLDKDPMKLVNTALRLAMSLRIATDETAYKQEYAKKLYKLVGTKESDIEDPNNSVALFSRYALGQITKSDLVNNVRQAQAVRRGVATKDQQQYWVMNRDGSGGKQMVYATSETEAIIKGGKQIGLDREQSISRLNAQLINRQPTEMPSTVPENWQYWTKETLPNMAKDRLDSIRQKMANGEQEYSLAPEAARWILSKIDNEIQSRLDRDNNAAPASVPESWLRWSEEDLPRVTVEIANSVRERIVNGYVNIDADANAWVLGQIDSELRRRQGQSAVDDNSSRWKVYFVSGGYNGQPMTAVFVDADSPRQAKFKAAEIYTRQLGIATLDINELDTMEVPQDAGREQPAQDTLSQSWQTWLGQVGRHANETLENMLRTIEAGTGDIVRMTPEQLNLIITTIHQELRSRGQISNDDIAQAAGNAENAVRQSLPDAHREFLELITDKSDMGLITTLSNPGTTAQLNDQQAAYFRITVKRELRRRGINPDEVPAQSSEQDVVPNYEVYDTDSGRVVTQFRADTAEEADRKFSEFEQNFDSDSDFSHQYRRIGSAAQQQQALEPDEPISSSDPEAASPLVPSTSPAANDNNARGDYEVYNPETMRIVSIIRGGTEIYADNKARELEQDLGLPADSLRTRRAGPVQGELDLQEMRRLAGLT